MLGTTCSSITGSAWRDTAEGDGVKQSCALGSPVHFCRWFREYHAVFQTTMVWQRDFNSSEPPKLRKVGWSLPFSSSSSCSAGRHLCKEAGQEGSLPGGSKPATLKWLLGMGCFEAAPWLAHAMGWSPCDTRTLCVSIFKHVESLCTSFRLWKSSPKNLPPKV